MDMGVDADEERYKQFELAHAVTTAVDTFHPMSRWESTNRISNDRRSQSKASRASRASHVTKSAGATWRRLDVRRSM
jgi:hypothetical protein